MLLCDTQVIPSVLVTTDGLVPDGNKQFTPDRATPRDVIQPHRAGIYFDPVAYICVRAGHDAIVISTAKQKIKKARFIVPSVVALEASADA
jgi:hypothetical protein